MNKIPFCESHPEISKEWHPILNKITSNEVSHGSHKKIWWLGKCGHEWDMSVKDRTAGNGCPFCAGKRVNLSNCLNTCFPEISKE